MLARRCALVVFVLFAASPALAVSFTSSVNGNWSSAATWGGSGVPGPADSATVNHIVTVDVPVSVTNLTLSGTLNGAQGITVTSTFTWSGGTLTGGGATTLPASAVTNVTGYGYLDGRPMSNAGTLNVTSSYYFQMMSNAVLTNSGTIDFQGDGGIYMNGAVGTTSVVSSGTIKKSGGTGSTSLTVPLTAQSSSQFLVQSGTFLVGAVSASSTTFNALANTTLYFNTNDTRSFDAGSFINGAGTVQWGGGTNTVNVTYNVTGATKNTGATTTINAITSIGDLTVSGGTLTLNSGSTVSVPTLTMQGGDLSGSAPISLTGAAMTWTGGSISGGIPLLTIPATTTITVSGYLTAIAAV